MVPMDALMKEHRQIEHVLPLLEKELSRLDAGGEVNSSFVASMVDFILTYADRCHHGKEEDILFRGLASKALSDEHRRIMDQLTEEHVLARKLVGGMLLDEARCAQRDKAGLKAMKADIRGLLDLYPRHMEVEEKHFFVPVMGYFSLAEQAEMSRAFAEFDAKLIHEKYKLVIEDLQRMHRS
jgi:hemerythrin-like domain-containing protein